MVDMKETLKYSKQLKLLYVEDNKDARDMTGMILEDFFDSIIFGVDGKDGYEKFLENKIDFVITDINMPKMNGLDMCKNIQKLDKNIPIIVLSAHNEENFLSQSIDIGVSAYLLKPLDMELLAKYILAVLQKEQLNTEVDLTLFQPITGVGDLKR